jgi:iron(III) transport system substrate-binding protein
MHRGLGFLPLAVLVALACGPSAAPSRDSGGAGSHAAAPRAAATSADAAWDAVVTAAKQEGKVTILSMATQPEAREVLAEGFRARYPEIEVNYNFVPAGQIPPKVIGEQGAGRYQYDFLIAGTTTILMALRPADALEPLHPYLVGPETQNQSQWLGGKLDYADDAAVYNLVFNAYIKLPFAFNPSLVPADQFRSWHDLLDPRWKGKIAMQDPRQAGSGQSIAAFWYSNDRLGKDYVRQMFAQQAPTLSRDDRQVSDWTARGQSLIGIGIGDNALLDLVVEKGLPIEPLPPDRLQEGTYLTSGVGTLTALKKPPHPNALRVYLDYFLSRDGQLAWSQMVRFASLRRDVPRDHVHPYVIPREGVPYLEQHKESYQTVKEEFEQFLRSLLP